MKDGTTEVTKEGRNKGRVQLIKGGTKERSNKGKNKGRKEGTKEQRGEETKEGRKDVYRFKSSGVPSWTRR